MPTLIIGVLALILILWLLNSFSRSNPHVIAAVLKTGGGIVALAGAAFFGMRGHLEAAIPLALAGLGLLGWLPWGAAGFGARTKKSQGQVSRVRTAFVEMELAHDTGLMRGRILVGRHEGASLDSLDVRTLAGLVGEIDEESRALLATYLDRRDPAWRQHAEEDAAAGFGGTPRRGPMTEQEAYEVLGLKPGASAEEIRRAYHLLMKKVHPDQGGTTYLAARINEAKDTLLRRHR